MMDNVECIEIRKLNGLVAKDVGYNRFWGLSREELGELEQNKYENLEEFLDNGLIEWNM